MLDQPTIGKWYIWFAVFAAVVLPYMAAARLMSDRRTRAGCWTFALLAAGLGVCLLSVLTPPFYWLLQYIHDMGFTPRRVGGLVYGVGGYLVVLGVVCWAVWPSNTSRGIDR